MERVHVASRTSLSPPRVLEYFPEQEGHRSSSTASVFIYALVAANQRIPLTDHYTSSIDATDWFSKIRRFLRQHGWTPLDERGK